MMIFCSDNELSQKIIYIDFVTFFY